MPERNRNHLLSLLAEADWAALRPEFESVRLPLHRQLEIRGHDVEWAYFPESGIVSVIAESTGRHQVETGIVGREGMTGVGVLMGDLCATQTVVVQVAGEGLRMAAARLRDLSADRPTLREALLRFARAFTIQTAHTALANGAGLLEQRLARWLLMLHDRIDSDALAITHDYIATMLSVRRPGVSVALKVLEEQGLIRVRRGQIAVIDRQGLFEKSGGLYGRTEHEYRRLLQWKPHGRGRSDQAS